MQTQIKTHNFFNTGTQRALYEKPDGYVSKEFYIKEHIDELKRKYGLKKIYRFDLGQNNDGCDSSVAREFDQLFHANDTRYYMKNYPEFVCRKLRNMIALIHKTIDPEWVLLSAGLDQMISMVASIFLEPKDRVLVNSPTFFLFEDYSKRMGAITVTLPLKEEDGFRWTEETLTNYRNILNKLKPKLIWVATPNNPTGCSIPEDMLVHIIEEAASHYAFIVVDEAYGEYTDDFNQVRSASKYLREYNNLIVLRTFSKGFGLANLRIGYAMTSDSDIIEALKLHRPYYPITQLSFDFACIALQNSVYIEAVRQRNVIRKIRFFNMISDLNTVSCIDTDSSIVMLKHNSLSAEELIVFLEKNGIIVSKIPGDEQFAREYVRITLCRTEEMEYMVDVLKQCPV